MAMITTTQTAVARYAAGLYGVKLGNATANAVFQDIQLNTTNGVSGLNAVLNSYYSPFAGMTSAQVAAIIVANVGIVEGQFGLTAANVADALSVVTAELNASAPVNNQGATIAKILEGFANNFLQPGNPFGDAARAFNAKISAAQAYSGTVGSQDVGFGVVNTAFELTTGTNDRVTGTAGDDTFTANFNGEANSLNSGDTINGGAGTDTLKAILANTGFAITPTITGVENIAITAQGDVVGDTGQNNVSGKDAVQLDFGRVTGVKQIWSLDSRADVSVEDVRIQNNEITKDITIVMRDTDPGAVDYAVYFDQNSLRNTSSATSLINLRVLDTNSTNLGLAPLKDSPYGSFTFSFSASGAPLQQATLSSPAIQAAQTFAEMVVALQAAADGIFGAGVVTVVTGGTYTVPDSVSGNLVTGTELVLSASGNITFDTTVPGSGWLATETVPAISGLYTSFNTNVASTTALVTSTIILDNVGRGSNGGDLIIGGLSTGQTSASKGVERFDITVEDNSKLSNILSTNNTLKEVYIKNGTTDEITDAYTTTVANSGNLIVGISNDQDSALSSGPQNQEDSAFGFNDVRVIDASAMTGKFEFSAQVSDLAFAKYLNLKDGAPAAAAADTQAFVYTGGSNNDVMNVTLDQSVVAAVNMVTGREDFSFTANGGAGNDKITVTIAGNETANWYQNHKANKNLTIDAGAGDDVVSLPGAGAAVVLAGAGNDVVYLDNSGLGSNAATWMINSSAGINDPLSGGNARGFMFGGKVTVSFSGAATGGGVTAGLADAVPANFTNGFEVVVDIPAGANSTVTQLAINQAIKKAINEDVVLKALLKAEDNPASSLKITSLIDGVFAAGDLQVTVSSTDLTTLTAAQQAAALTAYKAFAQDSSATIAAAQVANAATVVAANAATGMDTNQILGVNGLASAINLATAVTTPGVDAFAGAPASNEQNSFNLIDLAPGQTTIINGVTFTAGAGGATFTQVKAALIAGVAGAVTGGTVAGANAAAWAPTAGPGNVIIYTSTVAGPIAPNLADTGSSANPVFENPAVAAGAGATPAVAEIFTVTVTGTAAAGETLTFDGVTTAPLLATDTPALIAAAIAAGQAGGAWNAAVAGNVVTFTANTAGAIADVTGAAFVSSLGVQSNSAISVVESDNTVDLGAGNDVAVLGTGALSNDTVVFTGYNNGKNTIVNFEDTVLASQDLLNFKSYLNGKTSLSGSVESQKAIGVTLNADGITEANSVTVLNGTFTATDTFAGLTAAKLLAAVNSTNTGSASYAGVNAATLDALTTYTSTAGASNLVGGIGKAVVMVQNNLNEGEYQVFELTFNGLATNANKDFTAAELVGTVDFGNTIAFTQALLVA